MPSPPKNTANSSKANKLKCDPLARRLLQNMERARARTIAHLGGGVGDGETGNANICPTYQPVHPIKELYDKFERS